jgi:purine-binding chemotaxis protein CheW
MSNNFETFNGLDADLPGIPQEETHQIVAFVIDGQHYGIDIMAVREIRNWTGVTQLPNTPDYMMGVINLRGVIVPVVDMKIRFGLSRSEPTTANVVVIVAIGGKLHGLLVDSVSDIVTTKVSDISAIPAALGQSQNPLLSGLITVGGEMMALVALERMITPAAQGTATIAA